jgi:hypothetical protein
VEYPPQVACTPKYPNDSKLNRKVPLKIQYIVLISILTNNHTK